jgi:hypothetical protein
MAEAVTYKTYYVWLVAQKDEFAEALVAKMVRRGFTVGPLGRQLITKHDDNPACVVAMSVHRTPRNEQERKEYTAMGVHQEVTDVVKFIKGKFWGIVVSAAADCTWNTGNVSLKQEEDAKSIAAKKVN